MASDNQKSDLQTEKIKVLAVRVFGSEEIARRWLYSHNLALGDLPVSLLDTEAGRDDVRRVLVEIASGGAV